MKLVLIRHGESIYNQKNIFTGWMDADLSKKGILDAVQSAKTLKKAGFEFDLAYSSILKRSIKTLHVCLEKLDQLWIPVEKDWRINERHYGDLQGKNKDAARKKFGETQVQLWRRSYLTRPPELAKRDKRSATKNPTIKKLVELGKLKIEDIPHAENLKDVVTRVRKFYRYEIIPKLKKHKCILISAHGNSIRAFLKFMANISDDDIVNYEIPFDKPLIFELKENKTSGKIEFKKWYYLKNGKKSK